jgi:hypothetical protein
VIFIRQFEAKMKSPSSWTALLQSWDDHAPQETDTNTWSNTEGCRLEKKVRAVSRMGRRQ